MANARKILIVDDDTDLRDTLVEQLSLHEEFEASAVDTGAKGASAAKANSPDLVLMDVGLPDTDGREVVRSLRKGGFKAPIIMLTGHDTDSDTILGLESGANDYVAKPFRFAVLLARVPRPAPPARGQRGRGVFGRPLQLPARLQDADRRQCPESAADGEGNRDPAFPLPRRHRCRARRCCRKSPGATIRASPPTPWKPTSTVSGRRSKKMRPIRRSW